MNKISIIHTTCRPELALKVRQHWLGVAERSSDQIEYIFAYDKLKPDLKENTECIKLLSPYEHIEYSGFSLGQVKKANLAAEMATGNIIIQAADHWKAPKHWDTLLENCANWEKQVSLWVTNTCSDRKDLVQWIMSRARYEHLGYFQHPDFVHLYADDWNTWLARQDGTVVFAPHIVFTTMEGLPNTINDEFHGLTNSPQQYKDGRDIFERLKDEYHEKQ